VVADAGEPVLQDRRRALVVVGDPGNLVLAGHEVPQGQLDAQAESAVAGAEFPDADHVILVTVQCSRS
jgi:hypothetical protein